MSASAFIACNNESATNEMADTSIAGKEAPGAVQGKTCYTGNVGKDTVVMSTEKDGDYITGTLEYRFYEKDRNTGSFTGMMHGDTLIADYSFVSEGISNVRQIAFLKNGEQLSEGYGDVEEKDGKSVFKEKQSLRFGQGFVLNKSACSNLQ
jgi:hypothetical protein